MSANLRGQISAQVQRELQAAFALLQALSHTVNVLEQRIKALEDKPHGNRQRSTPGRN